LRIFKVSSTDFKIREVASMMILSLTLSKIISCPSVLPEIISESEVGISIFNSDKSISTLEPSLKFN